MSNPPNPWLSSAVEYFGDEEHPPAQLEVFEDHSRSIIAKNDSPDVCFDYSINPYRGCSHACAYCLAGDTRILRGDGTTSALADIRVGDVIYGTRREGAYRRYVRTRVLAHWSTVKAAYRVRLADGTELIASGDHRFLSARGWKHVTGAQHGAGRRPHLTTHDKLMGFGDLGAPPEATPEYKRGYLTGIIRGDALLKHFRYERPGRANGDQFQFRLALADLEALRRAREYLRERDIETHEFAFAAASGPRRAISAIRTHARAHYEAIAGIVEWPDAPSPEWERGFVAGIFDAEGSCSCGVLRISNTDARIIGETVRCLERRSFRCVVEPPGRNSVATNVRLLGGLRERMRFFQWAQPAISRKRDLEGLAIKCDASLEIEVIEPFGIDVSMFDITTGTGDFIANGVVSHNCYARPGHEYLSFGAGTDFDRKIVIKPRAPELLREAFEAKSWKGDFIMFSGVTDCYQPLEATYRLTRGCLEVCADYRNPCGIITKAPLIERDLDVLLRLQEVTDVGVTISIPIWDVDKARAIEPWVATPQRRMKTIAKLAAAGLDVGVNVAPMIPGLGDEDMGKVLEAAAEAGATHAGFVFLRLPGPVAVVFEERLREALPLRAERILSRIKEARGGKLYDSRWGTRQRGEGVYAEQARAVFDQTCKRLGLNARERTHKGDTFIRPPRAGQQMRLL